MRLKEAPLNRKGAMDAEKRVRERTLMRIEFQLPSFRGPRPVCFCTAIRADCSQAAMKISCCQTHEFVRVGLAGCRQRREDTAALRGHLPAVGSRDFGDQAMSVEQRQSSRDFGRLGAFLLLVFGFTEKQSPDLSVAEALERPFSPVDGCQ